MQDVYDLAVIGAGFFGSVLATEAAKSRPAARVVLIDSELGPCRRATTRNQARVHGGYHYPRSLTTAVRSRVNARPFVHEWRDAVVFQQTMLYGIARTASRVTATQFAAFCRTIDAPLLPAAPALSRLFDHRMIDSVFEVREPVFNAAVLAEMCLERLNSVGVECLFGHTVVDVDACPEGSSLTILKPDQSVMRLAAKAVVNCTYSDLAQFKSPGARLTTPLKLELTEMPLVVVPELLREVGVTVMDGPFFSLMPYPSRALHTLSHVRFTPHEAWLATSPGTSSNHVSGSSRPSNFDRMKRDAMRYLPALRKIEYVESLWETKALLVRSEDDDGRPILYERSDSLHGFTSILGAKLDNIFDVLSVFLSDWLRE